MEAWITVVVAGIVALSTLSATWLQSWFSNKRFKIEIGRAVDVDYRKRKWEVRSEPLLKLRDELACMASKQNRVVNAVNSLSTGDDDKKEKATKELQDVINEWKAYLSKGNLLQTLFIQYDSELFSKVVEIQESYIASYNDLISYGALKRAEQEKAIKSSGKVWQKVVEVQELINKRLEEL